MSAVPARRILSVLVAFTLWSLAGIPADWIRPLGSGPGGSSLGGPIGNGAAALLGPVPAHAEECVDYSDFLHAVGSLDLPDLTDVAVYGRYAYLTSSKLHVVDISDPSSPRVVAELQPSSQELRAITTDGSYAYVGTRSPSALMTVDIRDPLVPQFLGTVELENTASELAVQGGYVYAAEGYHGLQIVDCTNPAVPLVVGSADVDHFAYGVAARENRAYVSDTSHLYVFDVTNPASPFELGRADLAGYGEAVTVSGRYAYVAIEGGLQVVDLIDPQAPRPLGFVGGLGFSYEVAIAGGFAYLSSTDSGMLVVDVALPNAPRLLTKLVLDGSPRAVALSAGRVYLAGGGLQVIDVTNPRPPDAIGHVDLTGYALSVTAHGDYAYVGKDPALQVIDISDPSAPAIIGTGVPDSTGFIRSAQLEGNLLYISDSVPGLGILDVTHVAAPSVVSMTKLAGRAFDVCVRGPYAYAAVSIPGNLVIVDVSVPASPVILTTLPLPSSWVMAVDVVGNLAYVAAEQGGLIIVDVSDPSAAHIVGQVPTPWAAYDVTVVGNLAYVADIYWGLQVIDVSDPSAPVIIGARDLPGSVTGVTVSGNYAYAAGGIAGIHVVDISDPTAPFHVGCFPSTLEARMTAIEGGLAYVADAQNGLLVIPTQCDVASGAPDRVQNPLGRDGPSPLWLSAFPNPSRGEAQVRCGSSSPGAVRLSIFDPSGRQVRALFDGTVSGEGRAIFWNGRDDSGHPVPSGLYWIRGENRTGRASRALIVTR